MSDAEAPDLGPCCICEKPNGACVIIMLPRRGLVPGHGWGCFECDLPCDGAVAVICNECEPIFQADESALRFACRGFPASDGRVPVEELPPGDFDHDMSKHQARQ